MDQKPLLEGNPFPNRWETDPIKRWTPLTEKGEGGGADLTMGRFVTTAAVCWWGEGGLGRRGVYNKAGKPSLSDFLPQLFGVAGVPKALIQKSTKRSWESWLFGTQHGNNSLRRGALGPLPTSPASFVSCHHPRTPAALLRLHLARVGKVSLLFHNLVVCFF